MNYNCLKLFKVWAFFILTCFSLIQEKRNNQKTHKKQLTLSLTKTNNHGTTTY